MTPQRTKLLRLAGTNLMLFSIDMGGIWIIYFLAFGLWPAGAWGWFWLIVVGLFGRWVMHTIVALYRREEERDRMHATLDAGLSEVVRFHHYEAQQLLKLFGGEEAEISVAHWKAGHSGPGIYAWHTEHPEEGSVCISLPRLVKREMPA